MRSNSKRRAPTQCRGAIYPTAMCGGRRLINCWPMRRSEVCTTPSRTKRCGRSPTDRAPREENGSQLLFGKLRPQSRHWPQKILALANRFAIVVACSHNLHPATTTNSSHCSLISRINRFPTGRLAASFTWPPTEREPLALRASCPTDRDWNSPRCAKPRGRNCAQLNRNTPPIALLALPRRAARVSQPAPPPREWNKGTVICLRAHYTMDVLAGAVAALWATTRPTALRRQSTVARSEFRAARKHG